MSYLVYRFDNWYKNLINTIKNSENYDLFFDDISIIEVLRLLKMAKNGLKSKTNIFSNILLI